eukprot:gnl/TRDRNA2_/TRDRNA2_183887_c0_seq1.p1 gnl/TRDRNA2_/TRDRNA2_183887_c0~~gnl/TRDRNA2_/TRDRNA2_183887_c0_seq1.p1  ORF type:complete len:365 (+),score=64.47 gnl/TRDRNA2_/TRDRNA2_183887_c0_seq1:110-1204(+)
MPTDAFLTGSELGEGGQMDNLVEHPDLKNDPFWTHTDKSKRQEKAPPEQPGPMAQDVKKEKWTAYVLIYVPWLLFLWNLMMWLVLKHWAPALTLIITILIMLVCVFLMSIGQLASRFGAISYTALGALCLLATVSGFMCGLNGWNSTMRQYWWMRTGHQFTANSADSPAAARADASSLRFWDESTGSTIGNTAVDHTKSAGWHEDGNLYCAAPILTPSMADMGLNRVEYWAIGINCCANVGSFTCDDSRQWDGAYAVVLLGGAHGGGLPCTSCNNDQFRAAVAKAESIHGLVSAKGALYTRWVKSSDDYESGLMWDCISLIVVSAILSFIILGALGYACFHYGIGLPARKTQPGLRDARQKRQV